MFFERPVSTTLISEPRGVDGEFDLIDAEALVLSGRILNPEELEHERAARVGNRLQRLQRVAQKPKFELPS